MRDRNETPSKKIRANVIPIGIYSIIKITNVRFLSFYKQKRKNKKRRVQYRHSERMLAWRPKEFMEFWSRFVRE